MFWPITPSKESRRYFLHLLKLPTVRLKDQLLSRSNFISAVRYTCLHACTYAYECVHTCTELFLLTLELLDSGLGKGKGCVT